MKVRTIFILGAGQMGTGIAQVAAQAEFKVILRDVEERFVNKSMDIIRSSLERSKAKGKIDDKGQKEILDRIIATTDISIVKKADMVIEAIPEDVNLKKSELAHLDTLCPEDTIFASNTSSIPITKLASATSRPDRVIGTHFFAPVFLTKFVEVVRGYSTSDDTFEDTKKVLTQMGKDVILAKDFAGFATTRLMLPYLNEAAYLLYEGIISKEDLDKHSKMLMPMGPFEQMDYIGIDVVVATLRTVYECFGDHKYFPCPLLTKMVEAGKLGIKAGEGFYDYRQSG